MMRKLRACILFFTAVLFLTCCGAPEAGSAGESPTGTESAGDVKGTTESMRESGDEGTITVTDMAGYTVEVPADTAHNTTATTYGVITPFYVTLKMSDRVLATTIKNKGFMRKVDDVIIDAGDIGNRVVDGEALAAYAPDILMIRSSNVDKKEVGERLGIPTVMVYIETADQVVEAYELMGRMFGCEERAAELTGWINDELDNIRSLAADIPEEARKTVLCLGSKVSKIAGANMLQIMMIETAGGRSEVTEVADDLMWADIGVEAVFAKDPEVIFVTSSYPPDYTIDQLYADEAWSGMRAIRDHRVYQIPAQIDSWDMPGPAFVLGTYYMMHCMYPDIISREMMQEKVDDYYSLFYGRTFTGEEIGYSFD